MFFILQNQAREFRLKDAKIINFEVHSAVARFRQT